MEGTVSLPKQQKSQPFYQRQPFDVAAIQAIAIMTFFLPFVNYRGRGSPEVFTLNGFNFLSGFTILEGQLTIGTNGLMVIIVSLALLSIITSLLYPIIKKVKLCGYIFIISGTIQLFMFLAFNLYISEALRTARNPGLSIGVFIFAAFSLITIIRGGHLLYMSKHLTPIDFIVLPGFLYFLINNYIPMVGVSISFMDIHFARPLWESDFIGLGNFEFLFRTPDVWIFTRNTILYNGAFLILVPIFAILVAICLNEIISMRIKKIYQTLVLLPQLISIIIIAYIGFGFMSTTAGWINGLLNEPINFYATPRFWPFIIPTVHVWRQLGYTSLIYLAAIVSIDKSLYEAAHMDGAGKVQQIFMITIPLIKSTIIMLTLIGIGRIFYTDFGLFFQFPMDSGPLIPITQTTDTFIFRALFRVGNLGMAAAASTYQAVVGFVLILLANWVIRKVDSDSALF